MAIFYLAVDKLNRKNGSSSVGRAAYILRTDITDDRTGERHYQAWRMNHHSSPVTDLHTWTPDGERIDPAALWNIAEGAENRRDAAVARSMIVAIPHELTETQQQQAAAELMAAVMRRYNVAVTGAIHADEGNVHAHIMFTTREWDTKTKTLGAKTRILDVKKTSYKEMNWIRHEWANICNEKLSPENRICELSYKKQGMARKSQRHLGPAGAAIERRKKAELAAIQAEIKTLEAELGDIHNTRRGVYQGGNREADARDTQISGRASQSLVGHNRRTGNPKRITSAGARGQSHGPRAEAIRRRDTITETLERIAEASSLAARWRIIRDHEAATSRRRLIYDGTNPGEHDDTRPGER